MLRPSFCRTADMSRKLFLLLLIPALLLIGGYLYLRFSLQSAIEKDEAATGKTVPAKDTLDGKKVSPLDLRPLLIQRLQTVLKKSSAGLYDLSVADLELDALASVVTLKGLKLTPDSTVLDSLRKQKLLPEDVFSIRFDSLRIEGINADDAITANTMDYTLIRLIKPVISIHHKKSAATKDIKEKEDFAQRFLKEMQSLSIKNLVVEDGTINLYNATGTAPNVLKHVQINMNDIQLDSLTRLDKKRFLFAKSAAVSFSEYSRRTPDGLYQMKADKVAIKAPEDKVDITGFSFASPFSRTEFSARQKQSKEWYEVRLPSISLNGVRWWGLLNDEELSADALTVNGGKLNIFLDRSLPLKSKMGNFPNQMMMKIPLKMNVAKATIQNLDFSYAEYSPVSGQTGTVYIDDITMDIANFSNEQRTAPKPVTINGTALFMRKVPVSAQFTFDMKRYKTGTFSTHLTVDGYDGTLLNSFTEPMGLMKIERGTLYRSEAHISGDERKASGEVFIPYSDLKLSLLEKEKGKKDLDKKDVTSFLANLLLLKNDNPQTGKKSRREKADFTRIAEGGFFMLVWKTFLVGALRTIGAPEKIAYKTVASAKKE